MDRPKPISPIITITEAAEICGLSRTKASQLVRAGLIPSATDSTGALVLHRAEVDFWCRYGRTEQWRTAMNQANHVLDNPKRGPITDAEAITSALYVLGEISRDTDPATADILRRQHQRSDPIIQAQRRLIRSLTALRDWHPEQFAQPGLSAALGLECMEIARDTAMAELMDVGLGPWAVYVEASFAQEKAS